MAAGAAHGVLALVAPRVCPGEVPWSVCHGYRCWEGEDVLQGDGVMVAQQCE